MSMTAPTPGPTGPQLLHLDLILLLHMIAPAQVLWTLQPALPGFHLVPSFEMYFFVSSFYLILCAFPLRLGIFLSLER